MARARALLRHSVVWLIGAALIAVPLVSAAASDYPDKNIKCIVVWRAGGGADTATRIFNKYFETFLGRQVIVQNITGGGASVGYLAAKAARPDGYTLVTIQGDLPKFKPMKLAPIAVDDFDILEGYAYQAPVVVVRKDAPWNTIEEFVADCKANPGKRTIGVSDIGGTYHQPMVLWMDVAGFDAKAIAHPGSPQQTAALLGGHVDANITWVRPNIPYIKEGTLKFLAYMGSERLEEYPDVPTLKEKGWDITWEHPYGIGGPKGMPEAVKAKLSAATKKVWDVPEFEQDLKSLGLVLYRLDAQAFTKHMLKMEADMAKAIALINATQ